MKKAFTKTLVVALLAVSLLIGCSVSAFALPINNLGNSYTYDVNRNDASAPLAFTVEKVISVKDILPDVSSPKFSPSDIHYANNKLYILDSLGNSVYVLDEQFAVVSVIKNLSGDIPPVPVAPTEVGEEGEDTGAGVTMNGQALKSPEGLFVTADGNIYISDTGNQRIVVCNEKGEVSHVYQEIKCSVLGKSYTFSPTRLVVDNTGDIQVICEGINRGLMQITSDGEFRAFFGAPNVIISLWDRVWRSLASDAQKAKMELFTPTEYSSVAIDDRGFIYPTISALDKAAINALKSGTNKSSTYSPVRKLSADGTDMLRRQGFSSPMGDLKWRLMDNPLIVDIAVDSASGRYTILDQGTGRFYTYDEDGNLLYLCGGLGMANGLFQLPNAIAVNGDYVYVSDETAGTVTVFVATEYVHAINAAAQATSNGLWKESIPLWAEVLSYNSNMFIANIGLGKAEMRIAMNLIDDQKDEDGKNALDHYQRSIEYLDRADEKTNYSVCYAALRTNEMEKYFTWIIVGIGVLVIGIVVLVFFRNKKKKEQLKPVFRSSDREAPVVNRAKKEKGGEQ